MKIDSYDMVVMTRFRALTPDAAKSALAHILRELEQTLNIKYLRRPSHANRYRQLNQFGNIYEVNRSIERDFNSKTTIDNTIEQKLATFKCDYSSQTMVTKNGKTRKYSWQKR